MSTTFNLSQKLRAVQEDIEWMKDGRALLTLGKQKSRSRVDQVILVSVVTGELRRLHRERGKPSVGLVFTTRVTDRTRDRDF